MQSDMAEGFGAWVAQKCRERGLSLRQASIGAGLCHATVAAVVRGGRPSPGTVKNLAHFFSANPADPVQTAALEDYLLALAGHRTLLPQGKETESLGRVVAKLRGCEEREILLVEHFIDFLHDKV